MKQCTGCNKVLNLDQFHKGTQSYCKQCRSVIAKKWYANNKEKIKARAIKQQKELRTTNPDYSKQRYIENRGYYVEYNKRHMTELRKNAIDQFGGKCNCCGSSENLEFDHIDPLLKTINFQKILRNMDHAEWSNCQLLCRPCHIEKSNFDRKSKPLKVNVY